MPQRITLNNPWALGDSVVLSALPRDIHRAYPGQFELRAIGHYQSFWENNPYIKYESGIIRDRALTLKYREGITQSNKDLKIHFLTWFHREFERQTGYHVPVTEPRGDIHLTAKEKQPLITGRYWVVVAGGKRDVTVKVWLPERFQAVVDGLAKFGVPCVQAGAAAKDHFHPSLKNCLSMVGATDKVRDFFRLIYHADGVICGVTGAMHIAAAFEKPCVVIAGGREPPWWEGYSNHGQFPKECAPVKVPHRFLHTIGLLDCGIGNLQRGCWRDRTVPLEPADHVNRDKQKRLCKLPMRVNGYATPKCLEMIESAHVLEAAMSYYEDGTLPPIGRPNPKFVEPEVPSIAQLSEPPASPTLALIAETLQAKRSSPPAPVEMPQHLAAPDRDFAILDHPYLGGKVTVCVLCYGDYVDLAKRCIGGILDSVPAERLDLRVATNQVCAATAAYLQSLGKQMKITKLYVDDGARRKYQAMRAMFHDRDCPITTKYVVWFDDDSYPLDKKWLVRLGQTIIDNHNQGARLYGIKYVHDLAMYAKNGHNPKKWFEAASWWKGRDLRFRGRETTGPNASCLLFVAGWHWAVATEAIYACQIPDERLNHNGGDALIGEQVHQGGFTCKMYNEGKRYVYTPPKERGGRRGFSEPFPWSGPS